MIGVCMYVCMYVCMCVCVWAAGASALALTGLYVLPYRRAAIRRQLASKVKQMREQLLTFLDRNFASDLEASVSRIRSCISPYS